MEKLETEDGKAMVDVWVEGKGGLNAPWGKL